MTMSEAIAKAKRLAKKNERFYYVVQEYPDDDSYEVADDFDMDTFFLGSDSRIVYTAD